MLGRLVTPSEQPGSPGHALGTILLAHFALCAALCSLAVAWGALAFFRKAI